MGAGEPGRRRHHGSRAHLLHETGSLEIDPRVVVGSPSNNLKVGVTDSQVLSWIRTVWVLVWDYVCMTATGSGYLKVDLYWAMTLAIAAFALLKVSSLHS